MSLAENSTTVAQRVIDGAARAAKFPVAVPAVEGILSPEIFRRVFVSLSLPEDTGSVIGITSSTAGEGRTTIAMALAGTLAADLDRMVVLVDADFNRLSLAQHFPASASPGLPAVLRGEVTLADVMRQVSDRLFVVTGGNVGSGAPRLLRRLAEHDPFQSVRDLGAVTILDLAPLENNTYSSLVGSVSDALVLVIRAGVTPERVIRDAVERLGQHPLQGAILNGERSSLPRWWPGRHR